jgi:cell division protein FtsI (penicillin-binding protein 3)
MGFVPVDHPKLVILVMVDEPRGVIYGGDVAGPVFKEVGQWTLNRLRVQPSLKLAAAESIDRKQEPVKAVRKPVIHEGVNDGSRLPDFRGLTMREVLRDISSLGLNITLEGSGLAVAQSPEPGISLKEVKAVRVSFRPPG